MLSWFVHGYELQPNPSSEALVHVLVAALRMGLLGSKFTQYHVPEKAVLTWYKSSTVVNMLTQASTEIDAQFSRRHGYSPTFRELLAGLERFRHDDCVALRTPIELRKHPVSLHQHINVPSRLCPLHLPIGRDGESESSDRGDQVSSAPIWDETKQLAGLDERTNP